MTAWRDPDRLIRAFLDEGLTELPDHVYDAVRSDIDRTRQRVVIGPWRTPDRNTFAKLAIAAAAVVVVAIVGINVLPRTGGDVGIAQPTPSPTPTAAPTASPSASPSPAEVFPPEGPLAMGKRHDVTLEGVPLTFTVPTADWISNGSFGIDKSVGIGPKGAGFIMWTDTPVGVFSDPCRSTQGPDLGTSIPNLAAAVASIPGTDLVSAPKDVTVGGHPAKLIVIKIREDIGCQPEQFYLWYAPRPDFARYATRAGSTMRTWIIDVDGTPVWIDGETFKGAGKGPGQELQAVIDSIQFE